MTCPLVWKPNSDCSCLPADNLRFLAMEQFQPLRVAILGSGRGTNFVALSEAIQRDGLPVDVRLVVSDAETAPILEHARERGYPARYLPPGAFRTKLDEAAESSYLHALNEAGVEFLVLAGFMRILKGPLLHQFSGRVVNIHPSLLPAFPGLNAWQQALDYGVKVTGCTVHLVDEGVDTGPILAQQAVPVLDTDTPTTLHERIQVAERGLYPAVIGALARREIQVRGRLTRGFSGGR
jgi:phosphoribosylglycinamide formyltransferase 1